VCRPSSGEHGPYGGVVSLTFLQFDLAADALFMAAGRSQCLPRAHHQPMQLCGHLI
jgi:hypothetical protein